MISSVKFIDLNYLINNYIDNIDVIKDKHLGLLSELSIVPKLDTNMYLEHIRKISNMGTIIVSYIDDPISEKFDIIASGTIIIEPKLIRGGQNVGHIEDIVVSKKYQGKSISVGMLEMLKSIARENNCYKIILDCYEALKIVYSKAEFAESGIQMSLYF